MCDPNIFEIGSCICKIWTFLNWTPVFDNVFLSFVCVTVSDSYVSNFSIHMYDPDVIYVKSVHF
jgi:hypothetical protein